MTPQERRREKRRGAQEEITLSPAGAGMDPPTKAMLLDVSEGGFRARHSNLTLSGNQEIRFQMKGFSGTARVVWNRILGAEVESGFLITRRD